MTVKATHANRQKHYICPSCGLIGHGRKHMQGSRFTEIFLWVVFFIPGPFYSLWRHMSQTLRCARCDNSEIVSIDSAVGKRLFDEKMKK